jgi:cytochrome c-type biogenesis protein CcmH
MRHHLGWIAIGWLLAVCAVALVAYGNPAAAQSLDERTRAVAQQLRCPVCQGESVADSSAGISQAMRAIIRRRLSESESPNEITTYFVSKYGTWILLAPPSSGIGSLAWVAPPLLALGGLALFAALIADWRRRARAPEPVARGEYLARARAEAYRGKEPPS